MLQKVKIAIIGVWFGNFPEWIDLFFKSCEYNFNVDFYIFTDNKINNVSKNVKIINTDIAKLKELIQDKLELNISFEKPYKNCDYRPAYGIIFSDYLKGYDYWGHCDFDVIFGDIEKFALEYGINNYDKFLHLGHLSLYRNNEKVNNYYKLSGSKVGDYKKVFMSDKNYAFDETRGIDAIFEENKLPIFKKRIFAEIKTFHKRFRLRKRDKNYKHQAFYWENGKVYRAFTNSKKVKLQEFMYIHFRRKLSVQMINIDKAESFYITDKGFFEKKIGIPSVDEIEKYNHNPGVIQENLETIGFCINNIKKIRNYLHYF